MSRKRLILIITGGILSGILIFGLWLGGILFFSDRGISIQPGEWLYYLIMGIVVLLHPVLAKCLEAGYKKTTMFYNEVKIPVWAFLFTYILLGITCFPISHFETVLNLIAGITGYYPYYKRGLFWIVIILISIIPVLVSLIICTFVIEKSLGAPKKKASFILMEVSTFVGVSWGVCVSVGVIAHRYIAMYG